MAVETNGRPKETSKINGLANGNVITRQQSVKKKAKSNFFIQGLSMTTRLLIWYTIATALFRCPSSAVDLTYGSPKVCKPYIEARSYITPYVKPLYDLYASPYVEKARPYAETFNHHVYNPSINFGRQTYEVYGSPRVDQMREYADNQWKNMLKPKIDAAQAEVTRQYNLKLAPQVSKASGAAAPYYNITKENVLEIYNERILHAYATSRPYAEEIYSRIHGVAIGYGLPYAQSAWASSIVFVDHTLWPRLRVLYGENVEPQLLRISERLGRYRDGRKLKATMDDIVGSVSSSSISSSLYSVSSSIASAYTATAADSTLATVSPADIPTPSLTPEQEAEQTREKIENDLKIWQEKFAKAADKGTEDLQQRVMEITDRQIESQVMGVGEALVIQLEESFRKESAKLKSAIKRIVASISAHKSEQNTRNAESELFKATRSAGMSVKEKAQALRSWRHGFEQETRSLVAAASESTLEVIDNIRDLGLQEIGMRWAWMEDVTYKDWSNYHLLKKTFDEWRQEVEAVSQNHDGLRRSIEAANSIENRGMTFAEAAAKELGRLKEVGKWKIYASDASDDFSTRNIPPVAAVVGQKINQKFDSLSEQIVGTSQGSLESIVSQATQNVNEVASSASSNIVGKEPGVVDKAGYKISEINSAASSAVKRAVSGTSQPKVESIASAMKIKANHIIGDASEAVVGTPAPGYKSYASKLTENIKSASKAITEAISGSSTPLSESTSSVASSISSSVSSIVGQASRKVFAGAMAQEVKEQKPILDDVISDDDDITYSEKLQEMINKAGDRYADVTKAVNEALLQATKTQGSAESVSSLADAQYSSALAAASRALYGSQPGTVDSVTNLISGKYAEAVAAASSVIYGTPAPMTQSIAAQASSIYSDAVSRAQEQYSRAKSIASAQISGTPKPVHQEIYSSIENAYSESLEAATNRMQAAMDGASSMIYGKSLSPQESILSIAQEKYSTARAAALSQYDAAKSAIGSSSTPGYESMISKAGQQYSDLINAASSSFASATAAANQAYNRPGQGILASISSLASSRLADNLSAASAQYSSIKTAIGATPTPAHQQYLIEAQRRYYEAIGIAHERYSEFLTAASNGVYGAPTGTVESVSSIVSEKAVSISAAASTALIGSETPWTAAVASQASENWEALVSKASEQVYGPPTPFSQSVISQVGDYAAQATSAAATQYDAVQLLLSELISGKEPDFTESVMKRLSSAYNTGIHVNIASSASSYASEAYASASSVVSSVFTPPATLETIINAANDQLNSVVEAASVQYYGTSRGNYEKVTSAAASSYSSAQSVVSEAVYGSQPGYLASVSGSFDEVARSAHDAISVAIYGTTTAATASVTSALQNAYASVSSVVVENAAAASAAIDSTKAKISEAVYGPEQGAMESAASRLSTAVESAKARLAQFPEGANDVLNAARSGVEDMASSVSSIAAAATDKIRDEL